MKAYEYELPAETEEAAVRFMREAGEFRAEDLRTELERLGVPRILSKWRPALVPLAANLIQRHRLAGELHQVRRHVWCWVADGGGKAPVSTSATRSQETETLRR